MKWPRCAFVLIALLAVAGLALATGGVARASAAANAAGAGTTPATPCDPSGICTLDSLEPEASSEVTPGELESATLLFFWGVGCPHCEDARGFVEHLQRTRDIDVEAIEVRNDPEGRRRFAATMRRLNARAAGIPTFVVGGRYVVGFTKGVTDSELERLVDHALERGGAAAGDRDDGVQTTLFGWLSIRELGLPLFTVALGLLDGFNPCAMWVLVFLLAMLAGQQDRKRMAITAATFVVVSGLVYFSFMAAWLSVFIVIGIGRSVQVVLGSIALLMGVVNLKDFFVFGRGPSLSIPASAKPGIYERVRAVLREHSLTGSLLAVAALALLVNFVELLCTAGFPAIYTSILARRELSTWGRIGYLGLYNLAYVADDALMVTLAVVTLSRRRLAETTGRWLKLVSGGVMVALGLLLLLRPEWLP